MLYADYPTDDVRQYLQRELLRRCKANPHYSMRAFARTLRLESSVLSKILRGRRSVTPQTLRQIAGRLNLSPDQMNRFQGMLVERRGRRQRPAASPPNYAQLTVDSFQVIADWYHFAILELIAIKGFEPKAKWIARKLGISVSEANAAVERLQRLGMLAVGPDGKWLDRSGQVTNIHGDFTNAAHRMLQKQILEMAIRAIENVPLERRDNTGMTMAIDPSLLPEARQRIKKFRRGLCAFLQKNKNKTAVYQLGIALYPLSRPFEEKK